MKRWKKALAKNMADVMAHGPRLSYNRSTAVVATCQATDEAILTGLGGMGVGSMVVRLSDYDYATQARRDKVPDFATINEAWAYWNKEMFGMVAPDA